MKRNKISRMDIANYIGCSYRTINSRFCGESQWWFDECVMIRDEFFPELSLDYLFPYDKGAQRGGEGIYIISERIVNIAELEKILGRQQCAIISLRMELQKEQPSLAVLRTLISEMQTLNEKAVTFEFYLERRKAKKKICDF